MSPTPTSLQAMLTNCPAWVSRATLVLFTLWSALWRLISSTISFTAVMVRMMNSGTMVT